VAHDAVDGVRISGLVGPSSEGMAKGIEAEPLSFEARLSEKFVEFLVEAVHRNDLLDFVFGSP